MFLTINGVQYEFKATIHFMRKVNALVQQKVQGVKESQNIGLQYLIAQILDGDVDALITVLLALNSNKEPVLKEDVLINFIEDENTDIDDVFDKVIDFLEKANVTKTTLKRLRKLAAEADKEEA